MVMHAAEVQALRALREAIIADVREDMAAIDELNDWHSDLVAAWNQLDAAGVHAGAPITDRDLRG